MARKAFLVVVLVGLGASAQRPVWFGDGGITTWIGVSLAVVGDLDGDGYDDVATNGDYNSGPPRWQGYQVVAFHSGRDGHLIRYLRFRPQYTRGLNLAPAGDMDGDGRTDYLWEGPRGVGARSGRDDRVLWSKPGLRVSGIVGQYVAGDLDLNGDGRPDALVVQPPGLGERNVYAFDHRGRGIYTVKTLPGSVAKVGDVDRDGCDDFVLGWADKNDPRGGVRLFSGATGKLLARLYGELPGDYLGYSVTGCGDLDGDGVPDFAAGNGHSGERRGVVRVWSGRTLKPLYTLTGTAPYARYPDTSFGDYISGGVDFDRDGVPDIAVNARYEVVQLTPWLRGATYVFSGRDGSLIWKQPRVTEMPGGYLPGQFYFVRMMRPQPGSPWGRVLWSDDGFRRRNPWNPGSPRDGRIYCYEGAPRGVEIFGSPSRGALGTSPRIGLRDLGSKGVRIHLSGAPPGAPAVLLVGFSRTRYRSPLLPWDELPLLLEPLFPGLPGCVLRVSIDAVFAARTGTTGNAKGYAHVDLPVRLENPGTGALHAQWLCFGDGGKATEEPSGGLSDALTLHY